MKRDVYVLLLAQFLTAFADNAILFTAIAIVLHGGAFGDWYVPALQASFLVAFVVLAPWVGALADRRPKARVLTEANGVKALGTGLLLFGIEPLAAYAVVGIGAAVYSPAKYGILPELVSSQTLVKANGWIEGATILAIVGGSLFGGVIADYSINAALSAVFGLYLVSAVAALFIRRTAPRGDAGPGSVRYFVSATRRLLATPRARFATLGVSLFWAAASVLRVLLVAWAPVVLALSDTSDIARLTLYTAIGIAIGSVLAPKIVPLAQLRRARVAAYAMGLCILALAAVSTIWPARLVLLTAGICGGLFVVPVNAALQDIGHRSVGSGNAVAVQHFFENVAMLAATGLYSLAVWGGARPVPSLIVLALVVLVATFVISMRLPRGVPIGTAEPAPVVSNE